MIRADRYLKGETLNMRAQIGTAPTGKKEHGMHKSVVSMVFVVAMCGWMSGCIDERTLFEDLLDENGDNSDGNPDGTGDSDVDSDQNPSTDGSGDSDVDSDQDQATDEDTELSAFERLRNNGGMLKVDRVADVSNAQFPSDMFTEDDYSPTTDDITHLFSFSSELILEMVDDNEGTWPLFESTDDQLYYEFDTPEAPAAGRLIIWVDESGDGFQAEYTVYGSGVPIISSVRGQLILFIV